MWKTYFVQDNIKHQTSASADWSNGAFHLLHWEVVTIWVRVKVWQRVARMISKSRIRVCQSRKSSQVESGRVREEMLDRLELFGATITVSISKIYWVNHTSLWPWWLTWWWRWWQWWCWWWRWAENGPNITHQAFPKHGALASCGWGWQRALFKLVFKRLAQNSEPTRMKPIQTKGNILQGKTPPYQEYLWAVKIIPPTSAASRQLN